MILFGDPLVTLISFAPASKGQAPALPPLPPRVGIYFLNPLTTVITFTVTPMGQATPLVGAQYRLIQPHYLASGRREVGEVVRETDVTGLGDVPAGWVPTLAVDPLNSFAVTAFYNAGPRGISYEDLAQWANSQWDNVLPSTLVEPVTFWVKRGNQYFLTGLGAGFPPILVPLGG